MTVAATSSLFLALEVEDVVANQLRRFQKNVSELHWVPRAAFHVTLRYMHVIERRIELIERLSTVTSQPFDMKVSGVGHFELLDGAVALWAGVVPAPSMCSLHHILDRIAIDLGSLPPRSPWKPHISLGFRSETHPDMTRWENDHLNLNLPASRVSGFGLYTPRKLPGTGGYERLAWFPFPLLEKDEGALPHAQDEIKFPSPPNNEHLEGHDS